MADRIGEARIRIGFDAAKLTQALRLAHRAIEYQGVSMALSIWRMSLLDTQAREREARMRGDELLEDRLMRQRWSAKRRVHDLERRLSELAP